MIFVVVVFDFVALAVLELCVDQAGLELTEIRLPLPLHTSIKGVCHRTWMWLLCYIPSYNIGNCDRAPHPTLGR